MYNTPWRRDVIGVENERGEGRFVRRDKGVAGWKRRRNVMGRMRRRVRRIDLGRMDGIEL
jgi:hypothetical protein